MATKKKYRYLWYVVVLLLGIVLWIQGVGYYRLHIVNWVSKDGLSHGYYIYPGSSADSVIDLVKADYRLQSPLALRWHCRQAHFSMPKEGYYEFPSEMGDRVLIHRIQRGQETPIQLRFTNQIRNREQLAARLDKVLLLDSASIMQRLDSLDYMQHYGLNRETAVCLFLPNTYEVYWTISPDELFARMDKEYKRFWTDERRQKAASIGLTPTEVATLASIVESETHNTAEHPAIASLYMNRLRKGMLLQACPTVIFAVGDFSLRRVKRGHLQTDSPYNTYKYEGLPPGPIRCANGATMDAVLNAPKTDYLYMCANADWSGTHIFSSSYAAHERAAVAFRRELNKRHIQ